MLNLETLLAPMPDVTEAEAVAERFDRVLGLGLSRLGAAQREDLAVFAGAFAQGPMAHAVAEAVRAVERGEVLAHHFVALAAGRTAIDGAIYDERLEQAAAALGLSLNAAEVAQTPPRGPSVDAPLSSLQQWLLELALAGLGQVDGGLIEVAHGIAEVLEGLPELAQTARLFTGFLTELGARADKAPLTRWSQLWCQAILGSQVGPEQAMAREAQGTFWPLGAAMYHHPHAASLVAHGVWQDGDQRRVARCTVTTWRVEVLTGPDLWQMFSRLAPTLVAALRAGHGLHLSGPPARGADLIYDPSWTPAPAFDVFAAEPALSFDLLPPRRRHPMQMALPVALGECKVKSDEVNWSGGSLPLALSAASSYLGLDPTKITQTEAMTGLLIYRGQWCLQPMLLRTRSGKSTGLLGPPLALVPSAKKVKASTYEILKERSGKLLRA